MSPAPPTTTIEGTVEGDRLAMLARLSKGEATGGGRAGPAPGHIPAGRHQASEGDGKSQADKLEQERLVAALQAESGGTLDEKGSPDRPRTPQQVVGPRRYQERTARSASATRPYSMTRPQCGSGLAKPAVQASRPPHRQRASSPVSQHTAIRGEPPNPAMQTEGPNPNRSVSPETNTFYCGHRTSGFSSTSVSRPRKTFR